MKILVFFLFLCVVNCNGAKILAVFHSFSKSHHIMGEAIMKALVNRGHEVTMISGFPLKEAPPNYHDIYVPELKGDPAEQDKLMKEMLRQGSMWSSQAFANFQNMTLQVTELVFKNKDVQNLIATNQKFDLVFLDLFFNEAHFVFGHVFNAPIIVVATGGSNEISDKLVGNSAPSAYVPNKTLGFSDEMTFFQRVLNVVVAIVLNLLFQETKQEELVKKYFPDAPSLDTLKEKTALVFSNAHFSFETPRPYVPSIINIGGCHISDTKELPPDIKEFLDNASEGAIFFSLGSNIKISYFEERVLNDVLNAFRKSKMKVLMKWENDELPNKPDNVKIGKWLPQNSILAHPNTKVFITHGGLFSLIESLHFGVPIIGMPIYADQKANIPLAVRGGYALQVDYLEITEEKLSSAIEEITTNKKYAENAKKNSDLIKNQPMKPMDLAVYWTEHVLQHKGADHLKTKANKLAWYQLLLLDVAAFLLGTISLFLGIVYFILKKLLLCCRRRTPKKNTSMNESYKKRI